MDKLKVNSKLKFLVIAMALAASLFIPTDVEINPEIHLTVVDRDNNILEMKEVSHTWTYYGFKDVRGYSEGLITNFDGQVVIPKNAISRTVGVRVGQLLFRILTFWNPHMSFGSYNYVDIRYDGAMDGKAGQWFGRASFGEGFRPPSKFTIKVNEFLPDKEKTLKEKIEENKRDQERMKKNIEEIDKYLNPRK